MTDEMILAAFGFCVSLIAVVTPIIRLNTNITRLIVAVDSLQALLKEKTDKLDERVTKHGHEIDDLRDKTTEHEVRLDQLEKRE